VAAHGGKGVFDVVPPCKTPNLDSFAKECTAPDNACPVHMRILTGQRTLPCQESQKNFREFFIALFRRKCYNLLTFCCSGSNFFWFILMVYLNNGAKKGGPLRDSALIQD